MRLCFSIDALSAAGDKAWRLLDDGQRWRACRFAEALQEHDARLTDRGEAEDWVGRRLAKDKANVLKAKGKAGTFDFLMRGIFAHAVLHRLSPAPVPDKQQMVSVIRETPPGTPWLLYLNVAGHFCMLDTTSSKIIGNLDIAVRGEIASSEAFIGPQAAEKDILMDELWLQFLAGWDEHLQTSKMSAFVPDTEKLKEESFYLDRIRNWQPEKL